MANKQPVIGIVGGMGPLAGVILCSQIMACTEARTDQQHLSVILMSFPKDIADRTAFLEGRDRQNPGYQIAGVINNLVGAGASLIGIACNTSHSEEIFGVISEELDRINRKAGPGRIVRLLHMPMETCRYVKDRHPEISRVGIMVTNGTYRAGIYARPLTAMGYEVIMPDPVFQDEVIHRMVYDPHIGIKANPNRRDLKLEMLKEEAIQFFRRSIRMRSY